MKIHECSARAVFAISFFASSLKLSKRSEIGRGLTQTWKKHEKQMRLDMLNYGIFFQKCEGGLLPCGSIPIRVAAWQACYAPAQAGAEVSGAAQRSAGHRSDWIGSKLLSSARLRMLLTKLQGHPPGDVAGDADEKSAELATSCANQN